MSGVAGGRIMETGRGATRMRISRKEGTPRSRILWRKEDLRKARRVAQVWSETWTSRVPLRTDMAAE